MVRSVAVSLVLSAILIFAVLRVATIYQRNVQPQANSIDIYSDRMTFRYGTYRSRSSLAVALKAATDPPDKVVLHDCDADDELEVVVDLLKETGTTSFEIELPDDC